MKNKLQEIILKELTNLKIENPLPDKKIEDVDVLWNTFQFLKDYENNVKILQSENLRYNKRIFKQIDQFSKEREEL